MEHVQTKTELPITYRPSIIYSVPFIYFFIRYGLPSYLGLFSLKEHFVLAFFLFVLFGLPTTFLMFVIFNIKIKAVEDGLIYSKKIKVPWTEITKITAKSGLLPNIKIYYQTMKPYVPKGMTGIYSTKSMVNFLELLTIKSPQAEFGDGIIEFEEKYKTYISESLRQAINNKMTKKDSTQLVQVEKV